MSLHRSLYDTVVDNVSQLLTGLHRARDAARHLTVGYVWVNVVARRYFAMPPAGMKGSGVGREPIDEVVDYSKLQAVNVWYRPK